MMTNVQMTSAKTNDSGTTGGLELRWVPAVDKRGRTYMESRWILVGEADATPIVRAA